MKILQLFLLSLCLVCLSCLKTIAADNSSINQYYELINNAELAICNGYKTDAISLYDKAYSIRGNKMTSRHLYNYFAVCADLHEWNKCKQALTILKKRYWSLELFEMTIRNFDSATSTQLKRLYTDISVVPELNTELRRIADSLAKTDQITNKYLRSLNNGLLEGEHADSFHKLTSSQIVYLTKLFAPHFPGDEEIGRIDYPYGKLPYSVILHHNWQGDNRRDMDIILYNAMKEGKIAPDEFDYWISMYNYQHGTDTTFVFEGKELKVPLFPINFIIYQDSLFQLPVDSNKTKTCNTYRETIPGLCTVEELKKKIVYQYYNPRYHFVLPEYIDNAGEEFKRLRKHLIYLPAN